MPYIYQSSFEHSSCIDVFDELSQAIKAAAVNLEIGDAWPVKITSSDDGELIWEQSGPLTTQNTLKALAKDLEVEWPDYCD